MGSFPNQTLENELELVERAKTDDAAFGVLYEHYFSRIYSYIIKRTGSREVSEDILSETFMKAFLNLKKYEHKGYTFGAWLYRIATNKLIDHYRKAGRNQEVPFALKNDDDEEVEMDPADYHAASNPEFVTSQVMDQESVQIVLAKLSPKHQEVIHLKYFAEMSHEEIAETIGTTESNARVLLHRALKKFSEEYQDHVK